MQQEYQTTFVAYLVRTYLVRRYLSWRYQLETVWWMVYFFISCYVADTNILLIPEVDTYKTIEMLE